MTKSHQPHRKRFLNLIFKRSFKVKRLYYKVDKIFDRIEAERKVTK